MSKVAELNLKLDALEAASAAEKEQVTSAVNELKTEIQNLKDQVAAGGTTDAELAPAFERLDALTASIGSVYEPAEVPPVEPPVIEPPVIEPPVVVDPEFPTEPTEPGETV